MAKEILVTLEGDAVEIRAGSDDNSRKPRMGTNEAINLAAQILDCIKNAMDRPSESPLRQEPLLWFRHPVIEVGADSRDMLVLAFQSFSLPPIVYSLDDDAASVL